MVSRNNGGVQTSIKKSTGEGDRERDENLLERRRPADCRRLVPSACCRANLIDACSTARDIPERIVVLPQQCPVSTPFGLRGTATHYVMASPVAAAFKAQGLDKRGDSDHRS